MKIGRLTYLTGEGIKSIFTHGFMSFASVTVIIACLIIMGSFSLLAYNVDTNISNYESQNSVLAYVNENYTREEALDVGPKLEALNNVRSVEFISREEAMESFKEKYEERVFVDVDASTFRDRYVVYLDDLSLMASTQSDIENVRGIDDVSAHLEISQGFITLRNVITVVSVILIATLFVVSLFIMANTIKLASFGRKEEIAIMKMVGASNFFIRYPFVVEGLILGLLGSGLAFLLQWGLYTLITGRILVSPVSASLISIVPFETLMLPVLAIFLGVGLIVGAFGSNFAIRNYLKV